jgi:uncharacterized alkaline shock family protein YloU
MSETSGRLLERREMTSHASISNEILCSYAADTARDVRGVTGLVDGPLHLQRGVRVVDGEGGVEIEIRLAVEWGASAPAVAREVQRRVRDYLAQMAGIDVGAVDVVVAEIG